MPTFSSSPKQGPGRAPVPEGSVVRARIAHSMPPLPSQVAATLLLRYGLSVLRYNSQCRVRSVRLTTGWGSITMLSTYAQTGHQSYRFVFAR